jgi:hypothetical protein
MPLRYVYKLIRGLLRRRQLWRWSAGASVLGRAEAAQKASEPHGVGRATSKLQNYCCVGCPNTRARPETRTARPPCAAVPKTLDCLHALPICSAVHTLLKRRHSPRHPPFAPRHGSTGTVLKA